MPLLVGYKDGVYPSLSLRVICDYLRVSPEKMEILPGKHIRLVDADNPALDDVKDIPFIIYCSETSSDRMKPAVDDGITHYKITQCIIKPFTARRKISSPLLNFKR